MRVNFSKFSRTARAIVMAAAAMVMLATPAQAYTPPEPESESGGNEWWSYLSAGSTAGQSKSQKTTASECGAGYGRVGSHPIIDRENNGGDPYVGTLVVYWSGQEGRNCAIARCQGDDCGKRLYREVHIRRVGDTTWNGKWKGKKGSDAGWYRYYAGPVYSYPSTGRCIQLLAKFSSLASGQSRGDKGYAYVDRDYCG